MVDFAHIILLGAREGMYGRTIGEYQFTFSGGGSSWVRAFDSGEKLLEFLRSDIAVSADVAENALEQLHLTGKATLADVEIRESEAPAMGLEQLPSDS